MKHHYTRMKNLGAFIQESQKSYEELRTTVEKHNKDQVNNPISVPLSLDELWSQVKKEITDDHATPQSGHQTGQGYCDFFPLAYLSSYYIESYLIFSRILWRLRTSQKNKLFSSYDIAIELSSGCAPCLAALAGTDINVGTYLAIDSDLSNFIWKPVDIVSIPNALLWGGYTLYEGSMEKASMQKHKRHANPFRFHRMNLMNESIGESISGEKNTRGIIAETQKLSLFTKSEKISLKDKRILIITSKVMGEICGYDAKSQLVQKYLYNSVFQIAKHAKSVDYIDVSVPGCGMDVSRCSPAKGSENCCADRILKGNGWTQARRETVGGTQYPIKIPQELKAAYLPNKEAVSGTAFSLWKSPGKQSNR